MRENVLRYIRERRLLRAGNRVCVAVSGGADSVALLRVLLDLRGELGIVLSMAHFNHLLRGEASDADQAFTTALAHQHRTPLFTTRQAVPAIAAQRKKGLEETARELRYQWLQRIAGDNGLDVVATAHTLDDQAETVLMKFLRGAGTRGLAGIYPEVVLGAEAPSCSAGNDGTPEGVPLQTNQAIRLVRPLLGVTRFEVESYLTSLGQDWREDESNRDPRFTRNRVRHELLPLLEREYNPNLRQVLSDAAEIARAEEEYWNALAVRELAIRARRPRSLNLQGFTALPLAARRRVLRDFVDGAGCAADFEHIQNLLRCAGGEIESTTLPGDWLARREGEHLQLSNSRGPRPATEYCCLLPLPGVVRVDAIGVTLQARVVPSAEAESEAPGTLLDGSALAPQLTVRNWRPGDRYCPAHSRSEEKLKRLFSEAKIPEDQRASWPVVLSGEDIIWVRGFPVARRYAWTIGGGDAIRIEELG